MLHVIAGVVLLEVGHQVQDLPIGQHCLHTQNGAMEVTISHHTYSAGICGDIAANVATSLRSQIQGHRQSHVPGLLIEVLQDAARLHHRNAGHLVHGQHLVQTGQGEDNLIANGHRSAHQSGVATLRHHRQLPLVAVLQDGGHLGGGSWLQDQFAVS